MPKNVIQLVTCALKGKVCSCTVYDVYDEVLLYVIKGSRHSVRRTTALLHGTCSTYVRSGGWGGTTGPTGDQREGPASRWHWLWYNREHRLLVWYSGKHEQSRDSALADYDLAESMADLMECVVYCRVYWIVPSWLYTAWSNEWALSAFCSVPR